MKRIHRRTNIIRGETGLTERAEKILAAVVQEYVTTAVPVSSKTIAEKYGIGLSPASIRSIMAELERENYLTRPHTSAGRVPTDRSFRLYVDSLSELEEPRETDIDLISSCCNGPFGADLIMRRPTTARHTLTCCAGFVLTPRLRHLSIKQIRFLSINDTSLLVVIVSTGGFVQTRLVRLDEDIDHLDLEKISNYLTTLARGKTLEELRNRVLREMKKEKNLYDTLLKRALKLGEIAVKEVSTSPKEEIYVEGMTLIFEQPEFREDVERMRRLFNAFEEKSLLVKILDKSLEDKEPHIYMGSEWDVEEFEGLSFVTAPCRKDGYTIGTVGIIGPVRMNYPKIIPLVNYAAQFLGKAL